MIFSLILSLPAIGYFYYIIENHNFLNALFKYGKLNIYSNILTIFTIFLFYLIPIVIFNLRNILLFFKSNFLFFFFIFFSIMTVYSIDRFTNLEIIHFFIKRWRSFFKLFELLNFEVKLFMSLTAFFSIVILDYLFQKERINNYLLLFVIIFSLPLYALFQKYLDPLIFFIIFGLFKSSVLSEILTKQNINIKFFIFYFLSFYMFSLFYYSNIL